MESVDKKAYIEPVMTIHNISHADIIVTSETGVGGGGSDTIDNTNDPIAKVYY